MSLLNEILHVYIKMAPYLMFGFLFAGILHVFIDKEFILEHLGHNSFGAVIKASLFGVPLPLCSCSVIPTAISLKKSGASNSSVLSFLLSTPLTGVDSIVATYGFMGPVIGIFRPIAAFFIGIIGGFSALLIDTEQPKVEKSEEKSSCCCCSSNKAEKKEKITLWKKIKEIFNYAFKTLLDDITTPLITGIVISGVISWLIPDNFFADMSVPTLVQMLIMIVVGIPLYVCATSSLPIGAALILKGLSPGVIFVFLVAGPATNSATVALIIKQFGKKFFALYLSVVSILSMVFGLLLDKIIELYNLNVNIAIESHGHEESGLLFNILGILFFLMILASLRRRVLSKK